MQFKLKKYLLILLNLNELILINKISLKRSKILVFFSKFLKDNLNEIRTQVLETSGNGEKLQEFLFRLPKTEDLENNEAILKAKATAAFFKGDFRELYKVRIKTNPSLQRLDHFSVRGSLVYILRTSRQVVLWDFNAGCHGLLDDP